MNLPLFSLSVKDLLWHLVFLLLLEKVVFDWEIYFVVAYPDQSLVPWWWKENIVYIYIHVYIYMYYYVLKYFSSLDVLHLPNTPSQRWEFADSRLVRSVGSSGTCSKQTRTANNTLQLVLGSLELHWNKKYPMVIFNVMANDIKLMKTSRMY